MAETNRGIYWLASYPRSGNTWVRMFLRAFMFGECDINAHQDVVIGQHAHLHWQSTTPTPIHYLTQRDRIDYMPAAMKNALFMANGKDVRFKTHDANAIAFEQRIILKHITKGGVYLVRDPRDVVCSYAAYKDCSIDKAIDYLCMEQHTIGNQGTYDWHFLGNWSKHVISWAGEDKPDNVIAIRYEDMVEHPKEAFTAIVTAMGLDGQGKIGVEEALEQVEFEKLKKQEMEHEFHESEHKSGNFFRKGKIGGWKETLTGDQVQRIEEDHGEIMKVMQYEGETVGTTED